MPVRRLIAQRGERVLRERRRVRKGRRRTAVHDLRVATRRLQEAIDFCAPALPGIESRRVSRRAGRLRRSLGDRRDREVMLDLLSRLAHRVPPREREVLRDLEARFRAVVSIARNGRGTAPELPGISKRLGALLRRVGARFALPGSRSVSVLASRLAAVQAALPAARRGGAAALHRLRIDVKRWRYGLEIVQDAGGRTVTPALRQARALQRRLGRLHDLDILIPIVRRRGRGAGKKGLLARLSRERARRLAATHRTLERFRPEPFEPRTSARRTAA